MYQTSTAAKFMQIGPVSDETYEVIELINDYELPADFFQWLSEGRFTQKVIQEENIERKHRRIAQYHIDNSLVFTGRAEFDLEKLQKETIQFLTRGETPIISSRSEFSNIKKEKMTKITSESYYTLVSNIYDRHKLVGVSWEIYELPSIIQVYNNMKDPLRYWRKGNC